jgi:hypothetical protein
MQTAQTPQTDALALEQKQAKQARLAAIKKAKRTPVDAPKPTPKPVTRFSDALDSLIAAGKGVKRDGITYLEPGASFKKLPKAEPKQLTTVVRTTFQSND